MNAISASKNKSNQQVKSINRFHKAALIPSLLACCYATESLAQSQRQAIEEVVVTAQKREESLQDTPIAVTALTGNMLERQFALDLKDISGSVPSLVVTSVVNSGMTAAISIRGIGVQEADGFIDPSVGVVVDGVYQGSNTTALLDLFDVEQIEILRGPQGTLFGANTIGGVVNVTTAKPDSEFGGKVKVSAGNWGRRDTAISLTGPLIEDKLLAKIAIMQKKFDGFYENVIDGSDMGSQDVLSGRGYLSYVGAESFDATLQFEYGKGRNDSPVVMNYADPGMAFYVPGYSKTLGDSEDFNSATQVKDASDYDISGTTLTMNWELDAATITSISNYREFELDEWTDQDGSPQSLLDTRRITNNRQISQELRANIAISDRFDLTAGAYYFFQNWALNSYSDLTAFDVFLPGYEALMFPEQDDESYSVFAQGYYDLTGSVRLQAGLRYTYQEKEMTILNQTASFGNVLAETPASGKDHWENLGWRIGFDWQVDDGAMVYGYQARGFKSGGFNGRINFPEDIGPYDPEIVDTWEVGAKTDWFDGTLRINAALFYNDYQDMQVDQLRYVGADVVTRVENAAGAVIQGVELEVTAVPVAGLTLNASLSYMDAEYDDFYFDVDANPANGQEDASGLELRNAPQMQGSLGIAYDMDFGPGFSTFNLVASYSDERQTDTRNHPVGSIEAMWIYNASLRWTDSSETWSIALQGKNLSDEKYIASGFHAPGVMNFVAYGDRRTVAAEVAYNF
ncbi:TonB-dependent receptor [Aestuariicella hydrocarbonica]|uniref:TonB-dependent receptor n=1 Tax=Pseudomaricurvus hydrocarbonicus TaxID=1470433 RepID=A0A9E5JX00_9GAMM|nr:TonB-dependent receptor [Aestuariicella hydrocarbonica]NHO66844.1 TonB-dependent receptor [Aestuariicella hydrocarbonica]